MNKENKDCCSVCSADLETGAGRYQYDENSYCPTCWNNGLVLREIKDFHEKSDDNQ